VDVGYYSSVARITLNPRVFLSSCSLGRPAESLSASPSTHPLGLGGCTTPSGCGSPLRATTSGAVCGDRASIGQIFAHLLASEVELILCNDDEKMKRGTTSPTLHAPTPRRQCPRCGGARQQCLLCVATTTPQSRHGGAQGRRLLCVTLRHPSVGSRFPLKQPPGFPCGGMASAQGFLSRWSLEPEGCLSPSPSPSSSLPWSCYRQASTPTARCGGPVPAPRWSR